LLLSPLSSQPNAGKQRKSYRLEQMKSLRLADRVKDKGKMGYAKVVKSKG